MRRAPSGTALAAVAILLSACGSESADRSGSGAAADPPPTRVVATTAEGETVEVTDFVVACRASEEQQPPAQIVFALAGFGDDPEQPRTPEGPAMMIEAADSAEGTTVELPHIETYGSEKTFISVFVTEVGAVREIASSTELSTGEIEVVSASCEPTPRMEVRIDGAMGSELSDNITTVQGYVAAE